MNLPTNVVSTGKTSIQALWNDLVTIDRDADPVVNNKKTHYRYANIKCHLSQTNAPTLNQTSTVATTQPVYTLYVDTSVPLVTGDTLTIAHNGQTIKGVAGEPFNRSFSNAVKVNGVKIS